MSPQTGALGERAEKDDSRRGHVYIDCSLADKFSPNTTHRAAAGGGSCKEQRASVSPLCCMMTLRTSLDWDKFPNTRVASSTPSILVLSSSFIITGVGENQQRGDQRGETQMHRRIRQSDSLPILRLATVSRLRPRAEPSAW